MPPERPINRKEGEELLGIVNKEYQFFKWAALKGYVIPDDGWNIVCLQCKIVLPLWHEKSFYLHFLELHIDVVTLWGVSRCGLQA